MGNKLKAEKRRIIEKTGVEKLFFDFDISRFTSLGVGGSGFCLAVAGGRDELKKIISTCLEHGFGFMIIGDGTNILANDGYIDLVFIKLGKGFNYVRLVDDKNMLVGASYRLSRLVIEAGVFGFDLSFLSGIPGTVGGAIAGNSGDRERGICSIVRRLAGFFLHDNNLEEKSIEITYGNFGYRSLNIPDLLVVTDVLLEPEKLSSEVVQKKIRTKLDERSKNQPIGTRNAGCFFKNPSSCSRSAGELIEECGLKGFLYGGARVSPKHANFIENLGNATARDIIDLSKIVIGMVFKRTGLNLEYEIKRVGF
ncbi:MAG: UDP-N-acetylmuramate dehydrogenase [Actinobacteria bacterium]|nr:UDP-N-acetylmuramate dehydrogenase [Actinomycetota bacterium]